MVWIAGTMPRRWLSRSLSAGQWPDGPGVEGTPGRSSSIYSVCRRLGFEVTFIAPGRPRRGPRPEANTSRASWTLLASRSTRILDDTGGVLAGLTRPELLKQVHGALLVNVMGYLDDEAVLKMAGRRVFLDIDPGYSQMWHQLGQADQYAGHDGYATIAENLDDPACLIPMCGLDWITTPAPVVSTSGLPPPGPVFYYRGDLAKPLRNYRLRGQNIWFPGS